MVNFSYWDTVQEFTTNQAAFLWLDREPEFRCDSEAVRDISNRLYDAFKSGEIQGRDTSRKEIGKGKWDAFYPDERIIHYPGEIRLSRGSLRVWAELQGTRPAFLFPEDRPQPGAEQPAPVAEEPPLSPQRKTTLLKVIALLAIQNAKLKGVPYLKPGGGLNRKEISERLAALAKEILPAGNPMEVGPLYGLGVDNVRDIISEALKTIDPPQKD